MNSDTEFVRLSDLTKGELVIYQGKEYSVVKIDKTPWSWAAQTIVYGMRYQVYLKPSGLKYYSYKPANNSQAEHQKMYDLLEVHLKIVKRLSKVIDQHSSFEIERVRF